MHTFEEKILSSGQPLHRDKIDIVQINLGYDCNLSCHHCHVQAAPGRPEKMSRQTMEDCLDFIKKAEPSLVDLTGGSPELHPDLPFFIEALASLPFVKRLLLRTNMTLLQQEKYQPLLDLFVKQKVELIGSLPCYGEENVNAQRGNGVYARNIENLKLLNQLGYGKDNSPLQLNLVYNPGGAFLPAAQQELETAYKKELQKNYQISFDHLFTIANAPCGRFKEDLIDRGEYDGYMQLLEENFNPETLPRLMCVSQINIAWDGRVYDCDFNQALGMSLAGDKKIGQLSPAELFQEIRTADHCFCCTAGPGSSCQGSLDH